MEKADGFCGRVDEVNGRAIRDVDREQLVREIGDEAINAGVCQWIFGGRLGNDGDSVAMDLLGVVPGRDPREFRTDDTVVPRCEIFEGKLSVAENIDIGQPRNPSGLEAR